MSQSKTFSVLEVCCNTLSGLIIANLTWLYIVLPLADMYNWGMYETRTGPIWAVNIIFTAVSMIRGYFWRRLFNWREKWQK